MSNLHLNTGGGSNLRRVVGRCWGACDIQDAPLVKSVPGSPYYGDTYYCAICGDDWTVEDGCAWLDRPFQRGWRVAAIRHAAELWEAACEHPIRRDSDLYVMPCVCVPVDLAAVRRWYVRQPLPAGWRWTA